ncbi:MAG: eL32 family ribosomal protein [Candidatus Woesearchaeota archaeon]
MTNIKLLEVRNKLKQKKPDFIRQDGHKKKKLAKVWRKPRGWQNKVRLCKKGYVRRVEIGFGSPREVKGLTRDGFIPVFVSTLNEIRALDKKTEAAVLSSRLGGRKKLALLEEIKKLEIRIVNLKADQKIESIKKELDERKKKKTEIDKKEKEKTKEKTIEQKVEAELSDEEKKKTEKGEKDKLLTRKDGGF